MRRDIKRALVLLLVTLFSGVVPPASADPPNRWQQTEAESLARIGPSGVLWRFNYAADQTMPYFDPVCLASGGPSLTFNAPPDHAWHHALWFCWHTIDDVNYWEHVPATGRPAGHTSWSSPEIVTRDDGSARIVMQLDYAPTDSRPVQPVLSEVRVLDISSPTSSGRYEIAWDATFRAVDRDVVLACTPIPPHPQGKPWGGYAGLSVRFAEDLRQRRAVTDRGEVTFDSGGVHRSEGLACSYEGSLQGRPAGIAILSHPDNKRNPTPFYVIRSSMSYLNPSFLQSSPYVVAVGEPLRLRYRIIVHPDHWSPERLAEEVSRFGRTAP